MTNDQMATQATKAAPIQSHTGEVAVSGASGMIGSEVIRRLTEQDRAVIKLVRGTPKSTVTEAQWSVEEGLVNPKRLEGVSAVIHLAGENIAGGRWTEDRKRRIRNSRVQGTEQLCRDLAGLEHKPDVLVCASAIGYYGDRGTTVLDETSPAGKGFLPEVCVDWEAATKPAADAGIRVVNVRIGVVISKQGGALEKMLTPFKLGAGGKVGSGEQYWSWVSLDDVVGVMLHALNCAELSGPVNAVSPHAVTNAEFTEALGSVLHRPTLLPMPAFAAKLALGQMADDLLLASTHVVPKKLEETDYQFQYPQLRECLEHELNG